MFFRTFHFVDAAFLVLFFFPSWEKRNGTNDGNLVSDSSFKIFILVCAKVYFSSTLLMECCQELGVLRGRTPLLFCSILVEVASSFLWLFWS